MEAGVEAYYERRITEERAAALSASSPVIGQQHDELADLYEERLRAFSERQARPLRRVINNALV